MYSYWRRGLFGLIGGAANPRRAIPYPNAQPAGPGGLRIAIITTQSEECPGGVLLWRTSIPAKSGVYRTPRLESAPVGVREFTPHRRYIVAIVDAAFRNGFGFPPTGRRLIRYQGSIRARGICRPADPLPALEFSRPTDALCATGLRLHTFSTDGRPEMWKQRTPAPTKFKFTGM